MRLSLLAFIAFALAGVAAASAEPKSPPALTGKVSSAEEGAMEGVVVSAKKGIVTVSVVSDDKGRFSFPASKLDAGDYALSIRAAGYDLQGPKSVTVASDKPAEIDVKLGKTRNLAAQLTNLEWMLSAPGGDDQKRALTGCTNCHSVERILNSSYNADEFVDVMKRMATYSNNSFFKKPQIRQAARDLDRFVPNADKVAAYFASINRSTGDRKWDLKTMPRVSGAGTHVIITEFDLPDPTIQPHDVMVDADGIVWHSDFSGQILGRFDPKTLQYKTFAVPLQREGWPTGALDLEVDPHGDLWLGLMFQAGAAKFDRKTEKFQMIGCRIRACRASTR
jgi:virginiamycin B lyase